MSERRYLRVMAEALGEGLWDSGPVDLDTLPISAPLTARIRAWAEWHEQLDAEAWRKSDETELHWERMPGAPVAAFNREAHAIADALRAELAGWDIEVVEIDSWLSGLRT
jgi:hypothetical protein